MAEPTSTQQTRTAAFFDLDHTILHCNSGSRWVQFLRRRGEISTWNAIRAATWIARYKLSLLDMEAVTTIAVADLKGDVEDEIVAKTRRWLVEEIFAEVAPRARVVVDEHRQRGHVLAILSMSTNYITEPIAEHLGIPNVLCTRLHVENGVFVGTHIRPACYGAGKVHYAERFAEQHGVDLSSSFFYTDSYSDLPMLQRVGERRVINPDVRLRRHAERAGWSIDTW